MIRLTIDCVETEVDEGITILQAAASLGIEIPTMCYIANIKGHPSCMVCTVLDEASGTWLPSCSMPVAEGMKIITESDNLRAFRREAIELLLSDHVGDCEAPCRIACPAFMNIPLMNRKIAKGSFGEALQIVRQEIALPLVLGYICPAPCEKVCKRKPIDGAVSICLLKRFTADDPERRLHELSQAAKTGKRVAIIGTGPAGLSAAYFLLMKGHDVVLFDKQAEPGGALRYDIPDAELPRTALDAEIEVLKMLGALFIVNTEISVTQLKADGYGNFDAFILATGNKDVHPMDEVFDLDLGVKHFIHQDNFTTSIPGVFACGSIFRDLNMAVKAGAQGKIAAHNTDRFLKGEALQHEIPLFNSVIGHLNPAEFDEYLKESLPMNRVTPTPENAGSFSQEKAINEALRCMHCDCRKPASCKLRILATDYNANRRKFAGLERKPVRKYFQHDLVVYEPEKCIRCGICVEIASQDSSSLGLSYIGRGFDVEINVPFNKPIAQALHSKALECAAACPTGALAQKQAEEFE